MSFLYLLFFLLEVKKLQYNNYFLNEENFLLEESTFLSSLLSSSFFPSCLYFFSSVLKPKSYSHISGATSIWYKRKTLLDWSVRSFLWLKNAVNQIREMTTARVHTYRKQDMSEEPTIRGQIFTILNIQFDDPMQNVSIEPPLEIKLFTMTIHLSSTTINTLYYFIQSVVKYTT